ncbi:TPA: hypothetical protein ACS3VG_003451 [Klebsiella aerogenes]|uniref:hypothetical protein n=1 Tax=Klebsiella aerogenes TaxID=548 RepID=UPI00067F4FA5|nr:hypothetical protein [Klebsiella aerogenes]EIV9529788.1 hypothetical protein [Klebsiella aerogenes]EKV7529768.1 hypothetical protein [Klebsiella aerogenes]ELA2524395.1 hypothetical protein [Klebsiella aerogenes]KTJ68351.1 hypothetical protein ASU79_14980 [Klebsiella aerogenes]MBK1473159.1 hypothetical protein [Klebsiella aerogenes]
MNTLWSEFILLFNTNPALISFIWTVITFALGTYIGHWLAVNRDRRKEFNTIADPIAVELMQKIRLARKGQLNIVQISSSDIAELGRVLSYRKAQRLSQAFIAYEEACENCGGYVDGFYKFHSPEILIKGAENLLALLKRR